MDMALQAAENFISQDKCIVSVEPYGHGIIHDTFLVKLNNKPGSFILQRINKEVFTNPAAIMHNLGVVSAHILERIKVSNSRIDANWQMLQILPTRDGREFFIDADGVFWRALSFIREAISLEKIISLDDAREVGRALGTFHWLISGLSPELLHDTLPGFHNVEQYLKKYDAVLGKSKVGSGADKFCQQFVEERRNWAPILEIGRREKKLQVRIIHGDPKINNIMVDNTTGRAVSIIDLDTVMPGLVQYDIGDCLRSCCNTMGEEAADLSAVYFDCKRCEAVLSGYTDAAQGCLTDTDFDFFFDAIRLIPLELGLRFYTDHLEGNVYFKVSRQNQNLERAMVQFKLVESIEQQEDKLRAVIEDCRVVFRSSNS